MLEFRINAKIRFSHDAAHLALVDVMYRFVTRKYTFESGSVTQEFTCKGEHCEKVE